MAPPPETWLTTARKAARTTGPLLVRTSTSAVLARRALTVSDTQKVTLGVIAAYVVGIALLWNLPYIRWILWPFKVSYIISSPPLYHPFIHRISYTHTNIPV